MKKVILISNYFHFASEKASNRYRTLAEMLSSKSDIELEVITSKFYQRTKTKRINLENLTTDLPYKVTFIDEPGYRKNISFKRLHTSKIFARNVLSYLKSIPCPDLIYQVIPTLDVSYMVGKYAKKNKIPFVIDVQDLWPEAFHMAIKIPILSNVLFAPFLWKANSVYRKADAVCAVSKTYVERVLRVNKKVKIGHAVFIGIDLASFDCNKNNTKKCIQDKIRLAYCGSLEKSYNIKLVIDALSLLENPPEFIIMGEGDKRNEFESYSMYKGVKTVFTGYLPYTEMCRLLCDCDITVNPIIGTSVASIINKHGDYAASGLPVINTQNSKEYCSLIEDYKMGFNCLNGTPNELAEKIELLINNKKMRKEMGANARRCAEEKFNRNSTYNELILTIRKLI